MDDLYTYLGYLLIAILIHLILKTIYERSSVSKEGFMGLFTKMTNEKNTKLSDTDNDNDLVKNIEENIKNIQDATNKSIEMMNLTKNRKYWEELIIAMEDRISSFSLQSVATMAPMIKTDQENEKLIKIVGNLNELNKYRDTLKENMKYLDGLK
jgi:hypothetical protein